MKVISIGSDRNLFKDGSAVRQRQIEYGTLFDELHIIVFTKFGFEKKVQLSPNVWVYATNSFSKLTYVTRAVKIAGRIVKERNMKRMDALVTVQDPFESGLVGMRIKKKFGIPLHVQIHTDFLNPRFVQESPLNKVRVNIARRVLPHADGVRVVSQKVLESLKGIKLGFNVKPIVLPIFVDVSKYENAVVTTNLKEKYSQFNFIILVASRLTSEKNIPLALNVFKEITRRYQKIGLVIVGSGPERSRLENLVEDLNLGHSVVFEEWQSDLASYYKTAHMLLLTSNFEGYGLTIVEAIAAGCPVVSTDVGIADILLQDGISLVCPIGDKVCLVDKISRLIEDQGLRLNFAQEAGSRIEKIAIVDKNAYLEAYKQSFESVFGK